MFGENDELRDFLFYEKFKCTYRSLTENTSAALDICEDLAYRDFCRTIRFSGEHNKFKDSVKAVITQNIDGLISVHSQKDFDQKHKNLCEKIIETANFQKVLAADFTYGQAQKWLNMTLKYMLLMGFWNDKLQPIIGFLHVPVDNYITTAAKKNFGISITSKAWSKWDRDEYIDFQTRICNALDGVETPIEWENHTWIKIAQNRNK